MKLIEETFIFFLTQNQIHSKRSLYLNKRRIQIMKICARMFNEKYEVSDQKLRAKGEEQLVRLDGFKPDKLCK
jgi:hypothetical protein